MQTATKDGYRSATVSGVVINTILCASASLTSPFFYPALISLPDTSSEESGEPTRQAWPLLANTERPGETPSTQALA